MIEKWCVIGFNESLISCRLDFLAFLEYSRQSSDRVDSSRLSWNGSICSYSYETNFWSWNWSSILRFFPILKLKEARSCAFFQLRTITQVTARLRHLTNTNKNENTCRTQFIQFTRQETLATCAKFLVLVRNLMVLVSIYVCVIFNSQVARWETRACSSDHQLPFFGLYSFGFVCMCYICLLSRTCSLTESRPPIFSTKHPFFAVGSTRLDSNALRVLYRMHVFSSLQFIFPFFFLEGVSFSENSL